jgi:hypothetical protein
MNNMVGSDHRCPQCRGWLSVESCGGTLHTISKVIRGQLFDRGYDYLETKGYKCKACKITWNELDKCPDGIYVIGSDLGLNPHPYKTAEPEIKVETVYL